MFNRALLVAADVIERSHPGPLPVEGRGSRAAVFREFERLIAAELPRGFSDLGVDACQVNVQLVSLSPQRGERRGGVSKFNDVQSRSLRSLLLPKLSLVQLAKRIHLRPHCFL